MARSDSDIPSEKKYLTLPLLWYRWWMTMVVIMVSASCNKPGAPDCFQSAGSYSTVARDVEEFSSIEIRDYLQVELFDSTDTFVEITGPQNLLPDILTEVRDGRLHIDNLNTCDFVRSYKNKITVRIYAPSFDDIQNYGTGDISTVNTIECSSFKIENRLGAGVIDLTLQVDSAAVLTHTGVSDVILRGTSGKTSLFNQGLGIMDARQLFSDEVYVNNSSINDVYARSSGYLFAFVAFSGNIYYQGEPELVDEVIEGTGDIIYLP